MRLFLSFASEDINIAEQIYLALVNMGHKVFFDRDSLPPTVDYNSEIRKAIKASDLFIFLISTNSVTKPYTLTELKFAQKKWASPKGVVLPVLVSDTNYEEIPNYLKAVTVLEPVGNIAAEVAEEVSKIAGEEQPAIGSPPEPQPEQVAADYFDRAYEEANKGNLDAAIQNYTKAFHLNPKYALAYNNRGHAFLKKGDVDVALKDFDQAIFLDPQLAVAYNNRGSAFLEKGDLNGAIRDFNEAVRINPKFAEAYMNRGLARYHNGDLDGAIKEFNEAIRINPQLAQIYYNRGLAHAEKGDFDGAIRDYDQSIHVDPKYTYAYSSKGTARLEKGDIDGAIRDYSEAIHLDLRHANAYKGRAIAYEKKGDVDAAVQDYGELIRLNPNDYSGYILRGKTLSDKGDFRGAIGDFDQALQLKPKDYKVMALLYHYRAMAYAGRSDFSRAVEDLQNELGLIGDIITNREREKIRASIDKLRAKAKIGDGVA